MVTVKVFERKRANAGWELKYQDVFQTLAQALNCYGHWNQTDLSAVLFIRT